MNRRGFVRGLAALLPAVGLGALCGRAKAGAVEPEKWATRFWLRGGNTPKEQSLAIDRLTRDYETTLLGILVDSEPGTEIEFITQISVVRGKRS